ncbi:MAG: leucine-rich repeat domain-containing protein [Clostridiales bacterium]|nr:leucine-rich repeat domain-containing protein [Clostridiales bacterium]
MQSIKAKVLTMFMSVIMVVSMFPAFSLNAATNSCGTNATWNLSGNTLTISGSGDIADYPSGAPWYSSRSSIKKLVIGSEITRVGNYAFYGCYNISEIVFQGNKVKSFGEAAFASCSGIKNMVVPQGVVSLGKWCFTEAYLDSVTFPTSLKVIAYGAFARNNLVKVYLPAGVTTIGDFAFKSNYKLVRVSGGANLVTIGVQAFEFCDHLSYFAITSKKLKKISKCCFYCCSRLKTIYIKNTTKLTKKGVKYSLYLSSVKKVKVKKSKVKKYKKYFTYRNCGKRGVKVKK